ncbi:chromate efflux transporter [Sphingomonas sp. CJ99]
MTDARPVDYSIPSLFLRFLGFGCRAFGGPVAQIAMVREALVEQEGWISRERFNRLLAVMQVLPGPEAHELCVHLGMVKQGRIGGLVAGLGFMLPGFALMVACGWAYTKLIATRPGIDDALLGAQIAILAIIARAVQRIGGHILVGGMAWALAALGFLATLAGLPFWMALIAALFVQLTERLTLLRLSIAALSMAAYWRWGMDFGAGPVADGLPIATQATIIALFVAGLKGGLLTFGGAYTAIPYVRSDTVGRGFLTDGQFLDGVAIANVLPAPLVIFATFAGYVAGGLPGALAITAGMFLPAFAFSMILYERLESLIDNPALHRLLDGVAAGVVGIIAATLVDLAIQTFGTVAQPVAAAMILIASAIAVWRVKGAVVAPLVIAAAALIGWGVDMAGIG